jgi:four helix bundle protein
MSRTSDDRPTPKTRARRFEDLIAWQQARAVTKAIYSATRTRAFAGDFGLRDQIREAAASVMSNIAEGFERGSRPEFHKFLVIAKGSCAEVRSQLYIALDVGYLSTSEFDELSKMALGLSKLINALRQAVQRQRDMAS